ncbi:phosphatidylinositol:UDP-GlcNAc transferase PIG-C like protein [Zymoseptoria brevis]|uniref:Phosphatidylinositol:UDP-GlcNAc transferase PIG-C like protein n=1 Tax=Zymoseptoria brevis TaxID=1047168 RepID=A0A0F4GIA1_9PEZI|nr:phosphatidylinositol:UDP-GlcNAc transferase PIG-C like protein [Zymoseptoria brevis]
MPSLDPSFTTQSSRASSIHSHRRSSHYRGSDQHLRPEDAISPPRGSIREASSLERRDTVTALNAKAGYSSSRPRSTRDKRRGRSSSRRRNNGIAVPKENGQWKKLLWVKQSYPDNYTDEETFLDHLQRNPRLRPYEFWPLVADSTIILQHLCSVVIFVCCFTAFKQDRVSPQTVVGWATICTVAGWIFRDYWQSREDAADTIPPPDAEDDTSSSTSAGAEAESDVPTAMPTTIFSASSTPNHSRNPSAATSVNGATANAIPGVTTSTNPLLSHEVIPTTPAYIPPYGARPSAFSPRMQERLTTAKSAVLIYCSLLGLSPVLASLTESTSSDSIWALSTWLMCINVFTFDYGAGPEVKFPASLSTNAALMASTVLASRFTSTSHVFSLTLFSMEVFGLFPVFRRHLRHHSWVGHMCLTTVLVVLASGGLSMTISGGGWAMGVVGVVLGGMVCSLSMGMTSWWLIGLQRYKNEIRGPWDPARPIIRRHWD